MNESDEHFDKFGDLVEQRPIGRPRSGNEGIIQAAVRTILHAYDPKPDREGLAETPVRVQKALEFFTSGYMQNPADVLKMFADGGQQYDEMVFQGGIPCFSLCEHHMIPFFGVAHIGYISGGRIVGLSKLARVVEIYARRFQVQERMTRQIADALEKNLKAKGVGVVLRCRHLCMESRGVQKIGTVTYTSALTGGIKTDGTAREEFLKFVAQADSRTTGI